MEDLLKALRNIGLALPDPEQLLQLSDPDGQVQDNLARHLSLTPAKDELIPDDAHIQEAAEEAGSDADDDLALDPLVDADLFKGAVQALLENYNKAIDKERDALRKEKEALASPKKLKPVPLKALLARQAAEIKKRQEEVYVAGHDPESGRKRRRIYLPRQTFDGTGSYASDKPLAELVRLDADELEAPKRFAGRYILCKVASSLNLYVGCTFIGLLPSGNALPISIAHFTSNLHLSGKQLDAHLPVGTVLAIREPYITTNHFAKGGPCQAGKSVPGVRVDTPTDVHVLDRLAEADSSILDSVQWKVDVAQEQAQHFSDLHSLLRDSPAAANSKGCRWLQDGPLSRAVASAALEPIVALIHNLSAEEKDRLSQRTRQLIQSLLSETRPGAAYRELCAARLVGLTTSTSSLAVAQELELEGEVLYRLCDFEPSRVAFEAALQAYPDAQRAAAQERIFEKLNVVRAAQKASALGPSHENVWAYYYDSQSYATPRFDVQDWFGPVAIDNIPGAGRGLVLTRDVDEGEMLLCCKAAASSYAADPGCRGVHLLRYSVDSGVTSTTTQVLAATKSIHAIVDRPDKWTLPIMGLTAGPNVEYSRWVARAYPAPPPRTYTDAATDAEQLAARISACSLDDTEQKAALEQQWRRTVLEGAVRPPVDSSYVDGVLRFNAFGPAANPGGKSSSSADLDDAPQDNELSRSTMVHPLPAILNHACLPNVSSVFFGDIVTTRALHPLKKGTEIMHQYVKGEQPWLIRRSQLSKHGFACGCGICVLDERDGEDRVRERGQIVGGSLSMLQERSRIVLKSSAPESDASKGDKEVEDHKDLAESLEELIEKVQATYDSSRPGLRPDLMKILQLLALHQSQYDVDAAVKTELRALESIGCSLADGAGHARILDELPSLHFDGGITSMLTLAKLRLTEAHSDDRTAEARRWVEQAFYTHQCTIGGGLDIFLDRWLDAFPNLPFRDWLPRC